MLNEAPVDTSRILEAAEGDEEFMRQLVEVFLEDAHVRLSEIQAAVQAGDGVRLGRTAHQLKGSSANVGANQLSLYAKHLEAAGKDGKLGQAPALVDSLAREFERVRAQLEEMVAA